MIWCEENCILNLLYIDVFNGNQSINSRIVHFMAMTMVFIFIMFTIFIFILCATKEFEKMLAI